MPRLTRCIGGCLLALVAITGCGEKTITAVDFAKVCDQEADAWIATEGVLVLPATVVCHGSRKVNCELELHPPAGQAGDAIIASVRVGDGPNQMDALAEGYRAEDLVLRTDAGQTLGTGAAVRLTGQRGHGGRCRIYTKKIEAL